MAIRFRGTPDVKLSTDYQPLKRGVIYPGLVINITGESGLSLGSVPERYSNGQYSPYLINANISVEGDLGMLLRAEASFVVESDSDFTKYANSFLLGQKKVSFTYGWTSRYPAYESNKKGEWKNLVIYDFSWEFDAGTQRYICKFKAMGQASTIEDAEFAVKMNIPNATIKKRIEGTSIIQEIPISSMSDLITYDSQFAQFDSSVSTNANIAVQKLDERGIVKSISTPSGPAEVLVIPMLQSNWFSRLIANVVPFVKPTKKPKVYVTLRYLVNRILNDQVIQYHHTSNAFEATTQPLYQISGTVSVIGLPEFFSPDPTSVVFTGDTSGTYLSDGNIPVGVDFSKTELDKCIQSTELRLDMILISLDAIKAIEKELEKSKDTTSKAEKTDESSRTNITLSIKDFIGKISALINTNSGGLIDLTTYMDEDKARDGIPVFNIVDRNSRGNVSDIKPLILNNRFPGDGITLQANIVSEVPKDMIAMNAYATNIKGTTSRKLSGKQAFAEINRKANFASAGVLLPGTRTVRLPESEFDEDAIQSATREIKQYIQNRSVDDIAKTTNCPYPLKLKVQIVGTDGFRFGDLIAFKHLPSVYSDGVCFRVLRYKHTFENNNWVTDIETVFDLL